MLTYTKAIKPVSGVRCVCCGANESLERYHYVYENRSHAILECSSCRHLFMHPVPLISVDSRKMDTIDDAEMLGSPFLKWLYRMFIIGREIRIVRRSLDVEKPRLLDIGCGTGWNTAIWKECGFQVLGVELSPSRAAVAESKYGLTVIQTAVEELSLDERFDAIIIRHLLEHVAEPEPFLNKVRSLLKEEGLVVIVVPNINSIGRYLFREKWEWVLPWHVHFFSSGPLTALVQRSGFFKLRAYQTPSPLWYPHTIDHVTYSRWGWKMPRFLSVCLSLCLVFIGVLIGKNDNLTLVLRKSARNM